MRYRNEQPVHTMLRDERHDTYVFVSDNRVYNCGCRRCEKIDQHFLAVDGVRVSDYKVETDTNSE